MKSFRFAILTSAVLGLTTTCALADLEFSNQEYQEPPTKHKMLTLADNSTISGTMADGQKTTTIIDVNGNLKIQSGSSSSSPSSKPSGDPLKSTTPPADATSMAPDTANTLEQPSSNQASEGQGNVDQVTTDHNQTVPQTNQPLPQTNQAIDPNQPLAQPNQPISADQPMAQPNQPTSSDQPMAQPNQAMPTDQPMAQPNQAIPQANQPLAQPNQAMPQANQPMAQPNQAAPQPNQPQTTISPAQPQSLYNQPSNVP